MTTYSDIDQIPGSATSTVTEKHVYQTVEDFVAHVIYDGRFIDRFTIDPGGVAEHLGVGLTSAVIVALQGRDRGEVLAETTRKMTHEYGEQKKLVAPAPEGAIIAVVVIVTIVCVFIPSGPARRTVVDTSPNADEKL